MRPRDQEHQVKPPSTERVLALRRLHRSPDQSWVDWAIELLCQGAGSPSLRILAGESAPFHPFEIWSLIDRVIHELGLASFSSDQDAAFALATSVVRQILDREITLEQGLAELQSLYLEVGSPRTLHDFYLLNFALQDLQGSDAQFYWPGTDGQNIGTIIDERCHAWLEEHGPSSP